MLCVRHSHAIMRTPPPDLRQRILTLRDRLAEEKRFKKSLAITGHLLTAPLFKQHAAAVMSFASFRSEVNTFPLMTTLLAEGVRLFLPRSRPVTKEMDVYHIESLDTLTPGYCSILEPDPDKCRKADAREITCVLVPGSVFDKKKERMGYGGGFYDRFLRDKAPQAVRIGLAFSMQVVEHLTPRPHDQAMDLVVTEDGCF